MTRTTTLLTAVLIALATTLVPAGPAAATDGGGCGTPTGTSVPAGHHECSFGLQGTPITVFATSSVGSAHVRAVDPTTGTVLLECRVSGGSVQCGEDLGKVCFDDVCPSVATTAPITHATCMVDGLGTVTYWCSSGRGL